MVSGKLEAKHRLILTTAVVLLTLWGMTVLLFAPQRERLAQVRAEARRELQAVRTVEVFTLKHPDVEAYLDELDKKRLFLGKMLPDAPSLESYSAQLEAAAKQSGVSLVQVRPVGFVDRGDYQEIRLAVSVRGSLVQMLRFLKLLEEGPRFSLVSRVALPAAQGTTDGSLDIRIFSLKQ